MDNKKDRRRYLRQPALYDVKLTIGTRIFKAEVVNVSAGGMYIRTDQFIEEGQRVSLRFPILAFDRRPCITGTVVRSLDEGIAVVFDSPLEDRFPIGE